MQCDPSFNGRYRDVCCNVVVHLLSLTFTLGFSFTAFFHVNWSRRALALIVTF